jgi:hypothetical protein
MKTYKILMLGPSGAGKTVFLASLFKELAIQGEHGFFLEVEDKAKAKLLNDIYVEVATGDKWPYRTDYSQVFEWTFNCCVRTKDLSIHPACKFTYVDYAGGRLTDVYEETEEGFKLEDEIKNADALLGLLDGAKIAAFMSNNDERKTAILLHKDLPSILQLMQRSKAPIQFVISKWDLLENKFSLGQVRDRLLEYAPFKDLIKSQNNPVRLIPVSSVGTNFAIPLHDGGMKKIPGAIPRPFQVQVPLACVLPDGLKARILELKTQQEKLAQIEVKVKSKSGGLWSRVDEFITNTMVAWSAAFVKANLPNKYQLSQEWINWADKKVQVTQEKSIKREVEAAKKTEERIRRKEESIKQVKDEETALNHAIGRFIEIIELLDENFSASIILRK